MIFIYHSKNNNLCTTLKTIECWCNVEVHHPIQASWKISLTIQRNKNTIIIFKGIKPLTTKKRINQLASEPAITFKMRWCWNREVHILEALGLARQGYVILFFFRCNARACFASFSLNNKARINSEGSPSQYAFSLNLKYILEVVLKPFGTCTSLALAWRLPVPKWAFFCVLPTWAAWSTFFIYVANR